MDKNIFTLNNQTYSNNNNILPYFRNKSGPLISEKLIH